MSNKPKPVVDDATHTIGMILEPQSSLLDKRDAIHVAVLAVQAAHTLRAGEHVGLRRDGKVGVGIGNKTIGIVDPFLTTTVEPGQWFWMCLYPRTITSLQHVWAHPDVPETPEPEFVPQYSPTHNAGHLNDLVVSFVEEDTPVVAKAKNWIRAYADDLGVEYDELMNEAEEHARNGSYWNRGERFDGVYLRDEFWDHYEIVVDKLVSECYRGNFFSCSC